MNMRDSATSRFTFRSLFVLPIALTLILPISLFAQTTTPPALLPPRTSTPAGLTSCFDYYHFGSVPVSLSGSLAQVSVGAPLALSGTITNQNTYPIEGVKIYAKVFKSRGTTKDVNGPDVVDFFPLPDTYTLKAGETKLVGFTWNVPKDAEPGTYQVTTYVASSDRFNLQGLSFTDDVIGPLYQFTVVGEQRGAVRFKKDSVTVADQTFRFAAYPPRVSKETKNVPIEAIIANTTKTPAKASLTWKLYYWDALQQSHLIDEETKEVKVHPNASTTVSYTVTDTSHPVYFLLGTLTSGDTTSIIGVRYVREGVEDARLNFLTVNEYPAKEGSLAVACIHSTSDTLLQNGRLELSATSNGLLPFLRKTLAQNTYTGLVPGEILALTAPFTAAASSFTLNAKLYNGDVLIDEVTLPYNCKTLGASCDTSDTPLLLIAGVIALIILLILAAILVHKRRTPPPFTTPLS